MARLPSLYIPHGGGPCFFLEPPPGRPDPWQPMGDFLRGLLPLVTMGVWVAVQRNALNRTEFITLGKYLYDRKDQRMAGRLPAGFGRRGPGLAKARDSRTRRSANSSGQRRKTDGDIHNQEMGIRINAAAGIRSRRAPKIAGSIAALDRNGG